MERQPQLTGDELERVADRVGATEAGTPGPTTGPVDLIEALEAAPPTGHERHWVYEPAERFRILQSLLLADGAPWMARFGFLLAMSVVIATLGLANDQPAAIIGAMVVAPMMSPVLGVAASLTLGLGRRALRLVGIVVVSSLAAVAFSWVISASLVVHELTAEELSRTTPRLRDLVIALAAGGAGMYSVVRKDLSGVVPGVAIAVALVPPLATIGIVLELRDWSLAGGAALLYGINVLAIIVAAVVVLLVTDFIATPPVRNPRALALWAVLTAVALAVVVPVWRNSRRIDRETDFTRNAEEAVSLWAGEHTGHRVVGERIEPGRVELVIAGETMPPGLDELREATVTGAYPRPGLDVSWVESSVVELHPGG